MQSRTSHVYRPFGIERRSYMAKVTNQIQETSDHNRTCQILRACAETRVDGGARTEDGEIKHHCIDRLKKMAPKE